MSENRTDIDADQTVMVNFEKFNSASLDFFIYCFSRTTNWAQFQVAKHDVLLRISEIVAGEGAEIAFPTHTLYLANSVDVRPRLLETTQRENPAAKQSPVTEQELTASGGTRGGSGLSEQELARECR